MNTEIKTGDFVIYAGHPYEVADISNGVHIGIYDEPPSKPMNYPLSNCCGRPPIGEIHNGFAHCSDCKEMAEFSDHDEEPETNMNIIEKSQDHIKRLTNHASALSIKPESCSTDYTLEEIQQVINLGEWAQKAARELSGLATLVDWQSNSKRLCEQIEGSDAIGYEWIYWHKKQDEGKAAGERIVTLFDEFKKLSTSP